ncbi:hypothetical protein [Teichococcus aestuarii]|nr:hypothetical protein [Pseudoroseomonas aestuarii]
MRPCLIIAAGILAAAPLASLSPARSAEPLRMTACPSREKTEQILQSGGNLNPDGCRTVTVTRVDSPAGPVCVMNFGESQGIVGAITSAAVPTEWWTSCENLRQP